MCKINNFNFETNLFSLQISVSCFSDLFESQQADISADLTCMYKLCKSHEQTGALDQEKWRVKAI